MSNKKVGMKKKSITCGQVQNRDIVACFKVGSRC